MKRFALLIAGLAVSASAVAAEDVEFKNSAEFRVRYMNDINATGQEASGQKADTTGRFKLNVSARKGEKLQAYASLVHNSAFGGAQAGVSATTNETAYGTATANNLLIVNRAWGLWKATDSLVFKVGRFGLEVADGAVLAENDWEALPTAHEGLAAIWDTSFAGVAFFAVKTDEFTAASGNSDPERNLYGISADIKNMPEMIKMANIHFLQVNKDEATGTTPVGAQNLQHIGLTIGGDISNILYKVTGAFQSGVYSKTAAAEQKLSANMLDLMVGYSMPDVMGLKVTVGYHMDSGDDDPAAGDNKTYQPLYYDKHNYAGLMDVVRWGNLTYFDVNATMMAMTDLEIGLGYYMFSKTNDKDATTFGERYTGASQLSAVTGKAGEKDLGSEFDLFANKSYDSGLKIGARFGAFMPGTFLKDGSPKADKTIMQGMLQASLAF
jgi:hypothetical protein